MRRKKSHWEVRTRNGKESKWESEIRGKAAVRRSEVREKRKREGKIYGFGWSRVNALVVLVRKRCTQSYPLRV